MKALCVALSLTLFSPLAVAQDSDGFAQTITKSDRHGSIQWTQYGFLATHTSFNNRETTLTRANVARLTFQWAGEVGSIASSPVVGRGIVYAAADGMIFAFRASDGTPLWSHLSCSGVNTVQPALGPHALLVGDGGGDLAAYNPVTGDQIWCRDLSGSITSAPAVDEKTVYITNGSDVVAVDQLTGTGRWRFTPSDSNPVTNTPAVFDGVVFVTGGNSVFALDKTTGHELWRTDLGDQINISAPSVAGNIVYVGGTSLSALRASDGHLRWSADVGVDVTMPAIADNRVFVNSEDPIFGLFAFDANTGALVWRNEMPGEPLSTVTVANGVIFDIAEFGDLMMFNSATGAFLGTIVDPNGHQSQPNFGTQPAVVNGVVYIPNSDRVEAFRLPSAPGGVPTATCVYRKLPIDDLSTPSGINDVGAIVGSVFSRAESTTLSFLLFNGKTTQFRFPGSAFSSASSINNHAQIVGTLQFPDTINPAGYVVRDGRFHLIVVPNSGSNDAVDINDKGDIVGNLTTKDGVSKGYLLHNGTFHIFRFPGSAETNVTGINRDGIIIGTYLASVPFDARTAGDNIITHGFLVKDGVFTTLDFPGAQETFPTRINDEGEIIGYFEGTDFAHGFSFQNGKFQALNDPPNTQQVTPVGLNNHDQILTLSEFPSESFIGDCHTAF
jgi:outer membrane protein assembly factor BamB